jgi:hypothetical protein
MRRKSSLIALTRMLDDAHQPAPMRSDRRVFGKRSGLDVPASPSVQ